MFILHSITDEQKEHRGTTLKDLACWTNSRSCVFCDIAKIHSLVMCMSLRSHSLYMLIPNCVSLVYAVQNWLCLCRAQYFNQLLIILLGCK